MTGTELRQRREKLGLTQTALAPLLGRSTRQLARWEAQGHGTIKVTWLELAMWQVEFIQGAARDAA